MKPRAAIAIAIVVIVIVFVVIVVFVDRQMRPMAPQGSPQADRASLRRCAQLPPSR